MTIRIKGRTLKKVDLEAVVQGLGAAHVDLSELTKEECESGEYVPLGSPVVIPMTAAPNVNKRNLIYYFRPKNLGQKGTCLNEAVAYRILEQDEEQESRDEYAKQGYQCPLIVRYYGKK